MQAAPFLRCVIMSPVVRSALTYFFTYSHKLHDFREKKANSEQKMCVLVLSATFSAIFLSVRRISEILS